MILNPLKKENNTDALVKALEDANGTDGADAAGAVTADQQASTSSDPQTIDDQAFTAQQPVTDMVTQDGVDATTTDQPVATPETSVEGTAGEIATPELPSEQAPADQDSGISFDSNDLPAGLSSDAEAHLDTPTPATATPEDGELDGIKKSALEQLHPLIEKLDLEPSDKFDKYLMMLRASDDPALIKPAFDAAQGIVGEKEKAQALLDIINEINYITASKQQVATPEAPQL